MADSECTGGRRRLRREHLRVVPDSEPPTLEDDVEAYLGIAARMRGLAADLGLGDPVGRWCANQAGILERHADKIAAGEES